MKPARDRSYHVPYLYYLLVCICLPTIESVDLDMVRSMDSFGPASIQNTAV